MNIITKATATAVFYATLKRTGDIRKAAKERDIIIALIKPKAVFKGKKL